MKEKLEVSFLDATYEICKSAIDGRKYLKEMAQKIVDLYNNKKDLSVDEIVIINKDYYDKIDKCFKNVLLECME